MLTFSNSCESVETLSQTENGAQQRKALLHTWQVETVEIHLHDAPAAARLFAHLLGFASLGQIGQQAVALHKELTLFGRLRCTALGIKLRANFLA
jgi:hypothetical protein